MQVVFTDDMAVDPVGVLEDVLEFLELDLTDEDESKVSSSPPPLPFSSQRSFFFFCIA